MSAQVDYVCPMTYPSHYAKGEYGIPNPNDAPYRTIHLAMHDAIKMLGPRWGAANCGPIFKISLCPAAASATDPEEVRAQLQAAADLGIPDWTLWNARCSYTLSALQTPVKPATNTYQVTASTH